MTEDEVLELAKTAGIGRRFRTTPYSRNRMSQRGVVHADLVRVLCSAKTATYQTDVDRWRLEGGIDTENEELTVVLEIRADVVVVTLF